MITIIVIITILTTTTITTTATSSFYRPSPYLPYYLSAIFRSLHLRLNGRHLRRKKEITPDISFLYLTVYLERKKKLLATIRKGGSLSARELEGVGLQDVGWVALFCYLHCDWDTFCAGALISRACARLWLARIHGALIFSPNPPSSVSFHL